ncbi:MAG: DUF6785 family protein [bacterium]
MKDNIFRKIRAPIIGAILIPINCYWVVKCEIVISSIHATVLSILYNVIFTLLIIIFINELIGLILRSKLSSNELLIIYIMLAVATGLFGIDMMTLLVPIMGHSTWFATPENEWKELFSNYLPDALVVKDIKILKGYYEGNSSFWQSEILRAWIIPIALWTLFILLLFMTILFINIIIRKAWVEHEKLSYPVIQLPMEMATGRIFVNKNIWIGFGLAFIIDLLAGLHALYPVIPAPRVKWYNLAPFFNTKPWDAIDWLPIHFYPFVTGLGYIMPLDLSFSTWFFYLFWKIQLVFASAVGWRIEGRYLGWEKAGAWLGIGFLAIWTSRKIIFEAFKNISNKSISEPISSKIALPGFIVGFTMMIIFWSSFGVNVYAGIAFFAIYLIFSIAATRMRAELGPPTHELHFVGPDRMLTGILGSKHFSPETLSGFALLYWTNYGYRCHPMPHQLEGFKIAEQSNINPRLVFRVEIYALFIGIVSSFFILLSLFYKYGAVVRVHGGSLGPSWETYERLASLLSGQEMPDRSIIGQTSFGLGFTIFLMFMRRTFLWWKLHPVGFAVASGWSISWMWFSIFLGWTCKAIILKWGGLKLHRKSVPFFLGMILGQMTIGSIWSIVGMIIGRGIYSFFV